MSKTFVTGLFKTRAAAEAAVDAIIKRGYTRDDVSVMMSDSTRNKEFAVQTRSHAADGLGVGSTLGQVRAHHHVQTGVGEDGVYAYVQELQMSFAFDSRRLSIHLPTSARIQSVLVLPPVPGELPK